MNNVNFKMPTAKVKIFAFAFYLLPSVFLFSGCTSFEAGGNVQRGRYALLRGDAKSALGYFQRASEIDSNYTMRIGPMREGVWTYLGRAHYASGDFKSALKALEQARTRHPDDSFAPLYLGLALAKDGDRQRGVKELHAGLTGLNDWLEYINQYSADRAYWDPGAMIQSGIKKELARLDGKEINWNDLIAGAERIGTDLETEADEAAKEKRREQSDSARGDDKGK